MPDLLTLPPEPRPALPRLSTTKSPGQNSLLSRWCTGTRSVERMLHVRRGHRGHHLHSHPAGGPVSKGQGCSLPTCPPCGLGNLELSFRQEGGNSAAPLQSPCPASSRESLNPGLTLSRSQILPSHLADPRHP